MSELYGQTITPTEEGLPYVDQVFEILKQEIESGRWSEGDRLPSVPAVAKEVGISRFPVQQAYAKLRSLGLIDHSRGRGSFIPSRSRAASVTPLAILVPCSGDSGEVRTPHRVRFINDRAIQSGGQVHTLYLDTDEDWVERLRGDLLPDELGGVISLWPFEYTGDDPWLGVPFAYVGSSSQICQPCVCGDTHTSNYQLTRRVIEHGHIQTLFIGDPRESAHERAMRYMGYALAMEDAGLTPNRDAYETSLLVDDEDVPAVRGFLESHLAACGVTNGATVVISANRLLARQITAVADFMGLRIPDDLSIAGDAGRFIKTAGRKIEVTCNNFDHNALAGACFDLLNEQQRTGAYTHSRTMVRPSLIDGESLAEFCQS